MPHFLKAVNRGDTPGKKWKWIEEENQSGRKAAGVGLPCRPVLFSERYSWNGRA